MKNSSSGIIDKARFENYISTFLSIVGENIRYFRQLKGMSQEELVKKSGISRDVLSRIENGKNISLDNLLIIAKALGIEPWALLITKEKRNIFETFLKELSERTNILERLSAIEKKLNIK